MFDKDAIQQLAKAEAITAANANIETIDVAALPNDFTPHDLEKFALLRRRARGMMTTSNGEHFAKYVGDRAREGAAVFVDPNAMLATATLNLGTPDEPGHADDLAIFKPRITAAYQALGKATEGDITQQALAEFMEDWVDNITCLAADGSTIETKHAIAAVRRIKLEELRQLTSEVQDLQANRTAFEQVKATGDTNTLPSRLSFRTDPYLDFQKRTFDLRMAVHAGDKLRLQLRMVKREEHMEAMALELVGIVTTQIKATTDDMPVIVGTYVPKP